MIKITPIKTNKLLSKMTESDLLDPSLKIKEKPKRMGSERPDRKNSKKLRKVSIVKNSLSLRLNPTDNSRLKKSSKRSKFNGSDSENDFSSNRDYSEEQGDQKGALHVHSNTYLKSSSAYSKSSRHEKSRKTNSTFNSNFRLRK